MAQRQALKPADALQNRWISRPIVSHAARAYRRGVADLVEKPRSVRDLGAVDVSRLAAAVDAIPEGFWEVADAAKDNDFPCFHQTRHIVLRFVTDFDDPRAHFDKPLWPLWRKLLLPVMEQAIAPYGFAAPEFPKVMFARLAAGGRINRHVDARGTNLRTHKIHVPLITNPGARIEAGGELVHLECGFAYEINNINPHAASNDGTEDRIHLIFEVFEGAR